MYKIEFNKPVHVHFIGIGGISMSGLAKILLGEGFSISGSDARQSPLTTQLAEQGAAIFYGQSAANIIDGIDCVVYTAAISKDNSELQEAVSQKLPMLTRAQLLGQIMLNYKTPIAVAGTHGKTTTTSMISHILLAGDMDPTISVGGILKAISGNIRVGNSDTFITEACEYTNSFLDFNPKISVILNIEEDHLDFFKDLDDIMNSFRLFAAKLPDDGTLVINGDIEDVRTVYHDLNCRVVTYGFSPEFDYSAANIAYDAAGCVSFDLVRKGQAAGHITMSVPGSHNVSNALASIATAELLSLPMDVIKKGLLSFSGADRRFEYLGTFNDVAVIDDYAHHPTEIKATLCAAEHYPHKELWVVFQPHTYTRTKALFHEFAEVLSQVDHLVLTDIYAAREINTLGISSQDLADAIKKTGTDVYYISGFSEIESFCRENCSPGDLLITMGAGDVVNVGEALLR